MILNENGLGEYVPIWFQEIINSSQTATYWEPLVDDRTAKFIKEACTRLKQDTHVFVSAVETLEKFMDIRCRMQKPVEDMTLAAVCSVFLCSKHAGAQSDLRASHIEEYMTRVVNRGYTAQAIRTQEFDIFRTINGNLPLHTTIDDLNVLLEHYVKPMNLKADLNELCSAILKLYYIFRNRIFAELKATYQRNNQGFYAFTQCVRKRLYFPCGILLCALKVTKCRDFLDLEKIGKELGNLISVHEDHLHFLCDIIYNLVISDE